MKQTSLVGQKFGMLTVIADGPSVNGRSTSMCNCDCGRPDPVLKINKCLKDGSTKSCGCLCASSASKRVGKDLTGQTFGRLTVVQRAGTTKDGRIAWRCLCSCGNVCEASSHALLSGGKQSCGCQRKEASAATGKRTGAQNVIKAHQVAWEKAKTHGESKTRLYRIYQMMHQRCENAKFSSYNHYGGKGIRVCEEWQTYVGFEQWASSAGYDDSLTIDRIDPEGDYCPENCRWITKSENSERIADGKRRYWFFSERDAMYAEFDNLAKFLRTHPDINLTYTQAVDLLREKTTNTSYKLGRIT